jgi:predicted HicB family RNase H-like nuclease
MPEIHVKFSDAEHEAARVAAARRRVSLAELAREAVRAIVRETDATPHEPGNS